LIWFKAIEGLFIKLAIRTKLFFNQFSYSSLFLISNNKIPSDNEINTLAKNNTIPSKVIDEWFLWIEQCYYYLITKNKLYEIIKEINGKEKEFENKNKYMLLKLPEIIL